MAQDQIKAMMDCNPNQYDCDGAPGEGEPCPYRDVCPWMNPEIHQALMDDLVKDENGEMQIPW